jgi:uncharacterized protein (TIRG00374 family)
MKPWLKTLLKTLAGFLIIGILVYTIKLDDLINIFKTINLWYLIPALIFLSLHYLFCIFNFKMVIDKFKLTSFRENVRYYFMTLAAGAILPSRLGDLSIIYFLKKDNMELHKAGTVMVMMSGMSFIFAIFVALFGLYYFFNKAFLYLIILSAIGLGVMIAIMMNGSWLIFVRGLMPAFIRKYIDEYIDSVKFFMDDRKLVAKIFGIIAIRWSFKAMYVFFMLMAFGQFVWPSIILLVLCMEVFTSIIPITVAGTGFRESLAVYLFSLKGVPAAATLGAYLLQLFIFYLVAISSTFLIKGKVEQ